MTTVTTAAPAGGSVRLWLRLAGAALLVATGAIHLDLYLTGYNSLHTIGPLFLLQIIVAFVLAAAVALTGSRLVAVVGALFAITTLGGYLLSLWVGLFGFREVRTTAGIVAGIIEVATLAVLGALAVLPAKGSSGLADRIDGKAGARLGRLASRAPGGLRGAEGGVGAISLIALVVLLASVGTAKTPAASSGKTLGTAVINGRTVLTNAKGFTVYMFAIDPPGKSKCNGGCTAYWPPVSGPVKAPGISGTVSVITRSDGSKQAAWNGHPLYIYIGDSKPGQANGNNVNLDGGVWHEVVVSKS